MARWQVCALALVAAGVMGCKSADTKKRIPAAALTVLDQSERFELLSLDPEATHRGEKPPNAFHSWKVLGSTTVEDARTREELVAALKRGVEENRGVVAACFNPRHGIRVTQGGKVADFVICFECFSAQVYLDEQPAQGFLVTGSPQRVFDQALRDARVPLAEKPQ